MGGNSAATSLGVGERHSSLAWALAFAMMTAAIGVSAIHHEPSMPTAAVGVCFSASVTAMTLALGIVLIVANRAAAQRVADRQVEAAVAGRAGTLLPVALLTMLVGFSGTLQPKHAAMLAVEGLAIVPLCLRFGRLSINAAGVIQLLIAFGLIALSGWAAITATAGLSAGSDLFRPAVASSLVLGPIVVLPMIPMLATLAENGMATEAIETLVLLVLLNLCGVLPILAALHPGMAIPILSWRLDSLLLVVIGLLLLPPAIGRWTLGKREGVALVAGFVVYLMITLIVTFS